MRCWFSATPPPDFQSYFMFVTFVSCSIQLCNYFFLECLNRRSYHNFLGIVGYVTDKMENICTDQSRTTSPRSHYRVRAIFFQRWWKNILQTVSLSSLTLTRGDAKSSLARRAGIVDAASVASPRQFRNWSVSNEEARYQNDRSRRLLWSKFSFHCGDSFHIHEKCYSFYRCTVHMHQTQVVAFDWWSQKKILYFNRLRRVELFSTFPISYTFETTP